MDTTETITKERLVEALRELHDARDVEVAHQAADALLLAYVGDSEVTEAFDKVPRWYA